MKNAKKIILPILISSLLVSCNTEIKEENRIVDNGVYIFSPSLHLVSDDFDGLGVEWGAYEDTNKLQTNAWDRIEKYANRMDGMSLVRCMVSYDWFCEDLDTKGDTDKTNDTWTYNFTNKWMKSTEDVLTYCQTHDIDVAFGAWNVIGSFQNDIWGMMDEVTSDPRWAKITVDVLTYLIKNKGFSCIKYFVNSNEPNYTGFEGASKNYNNNFNVWKQGVLNVRRALDNAGLSNVKIVGGDATGETGITEYLYGISNDAELKNAVGDYGFHMYTPKMWIDQGTLLDKYKEHFNNIKNNDSKIGIDRKPHIWECGLIDGKTAADCQMLITEFSYANAMADFTIESLVSGVNGIAYWDFDDAMHFMYNSDGTTTPKEWGMFSTLSSAPLNMQKLRPWYHSSMLLMNLFRKHNVIFDAGRNSSVDNPNVRSMATISSDRQLAGVVFTNNSLSSKQVEFVIDQEYENKEKMYVYIFSEKYTQLDEDGFVKPNFIINGSMSKKTTLTLPGECFVLVSNRSL